MNISMKKYETKGGGKVVVDSLRESFLWLFLEVASQEESVLEFQRKPTATCDFPVGRGVLAPVPPPLNPPM